MPDWSYRTFLRPILFALPAERARDLTIGVIGKGAALPGGKAFLTAFGDLAPPPALATELAGIPLRSPVGLGAGLDPSGRAARAWESFGFGFIEIGPITVTPVSSTTSIIRDPRGEGLIVPKAPVNPGVDAVCASLKKTGAVGIPMAFRLASAADTDPAHAASEHRALARRLLESAALFTLDWTGVLGAIAWSREHWETYLTTLNPRDQDVWENRPMFGVAAPECDPAALATVLPLVIDRGLAGSVVGDGVQLPSGRRFVGPAALQATCATVQHARQVLGKRAAIVAGGGITEPADAVLLQEAGADAVQVTSGLVYAGPALPRRIGETILAARAVSAGLLRHPSQVTEQGMAPSGALRKENVTLTPAIVSAARGLILDWRANWPWASILGAGMVLGGALAWLVAIVRVVLPYDEAFLGLTYAQLARANPKLLSFMAHDRVTLAGTMISIGVLYAGLALGPLRNGARWARRALIASAGVGFASFALVLGYRYVDPLHALDSLVLLPVYVLMVRGHMASPPPPRADPRNDRAWLLAQWGQLVLITLGIGFIGGGLVITSVGVTDVFVRQDLAYMQTTAAAVSAVNPHLVSVIAHDRAGFGGALLADGVGFLLVALWGVRRGARAVWWTLLLAGIPGFAGAIGVHLAVGYDDFLHLAPVSLALLIWIAGLALCRPYCWDADAPIALANLPVQKGDETTLDSSNRH